MRGRAPGDCRACSPGRGVVRYPRHPASAANGHPRGARATCDQAHRGRRHSDYCEDGGSGRGWTNFLARAMHGGMRWDPWRPDAVDGGAIKLAGARILGTSRPRRAATRRPGTSIRRRCRGRLKRRSGRSSKDHYGILEIFVDTSGRLVELDNYGMRLDNVGPKVRGQLRTLGRVRETEVNKIVRMCSYRHNGVDVDPPAPIASILITARWVRARPRLGTVRAGPRQRRLRSPGAPLDVKGNWAVAWTS